MRWRSAHALGRYRATRGLYIPFGWNTLVVKRTLGGLSGYWSQKVIRKLKMPPSHGVSAGPKIVAAHTNIFSSLSGAALAPWQRRESRESVHPRNSGRQQERLQQQLLQLNKGRLSLHARNLPLGHPSASRAGHS